MRQHYQVRANTAEAYLVHIMFQSLVGRVVVPCGRAASVVGHVIVHCGLAASVVGHVIVRCGLAASVVDQVLSCLELGCLFFQI